MPDKQQHWPREDWDDLILRHLDGDLPEAELSELVALFDAPAFQLQFARFAIDSALLHETMRLQAPSANCERNGRRSWRTARLRRLVRRPRWALAGVALAAIAVSAFLSSRHGNAAGGASVRRFVGNVVIDNEPATVGARLQPAQIVRTIGGSSFVWLAYADGTQLQLVGDSAVNCEEDGDGQKRVHIRRGRVSASVAPQPHDLPLVIETETALMEVVGTDLAVCAEEDSTQLNVVTGAVKLRRQADGEEVMVKRGQYAVASRKTLIEARNAAPAPDECTIDFSQGLPEGWVRGVLIDNPSTPGGKAVAAEFSPHDRYFLLQSNNAWSDGLFRVHDDTYLNFRIKMDRPEWYQLFVCLRDDRYRTPGDFPNREYQEAIDAKAIAPGEWRTVSVPLSQLRRPVSEFTPLQDIPPYHSLPIDPPPAGSTVFGLLFSTQLEDRGLAVDRIWVTRGKAAPD